MKEGMNRYAIKNRLQQKGYFFKYSDGSSGRKAREASRRDSLQQSRQEQKEEVNPGLSLDLREIVEKEIYWYGKTVLLTEDVIYTGEDNESVRKEDPLETYQEGRQGVSCSDQERHETEETNTCKTKGKKMKKQSMKERNHEARETKAFEKKEDKRENKSKKK